MHRYLFILFTCLFYGNSGYTHVIKIQFNHEWQQKPCTLHTNYLIDTSNIEINTCKYYISNVQFTYHGKVVWQELNSFHLINEAIESSKFWLLSVPDHIQYNQISFMLGIDSSIQAEGVKGGDLDPVLGMYWTWQSGYIHAKFEGKSNLSPGPIHEFQYHIGGYQFPHQTMQIITGNVEVGKQISVTLDVFSLIQTIHKLDIFKILEPSTTAVFFSSVMAKQFKINR